MFVSKTPYRISFFGGGTDLPVWFRENEGAVLSTTIDKYCYLTCRELPSFYNYKHRLVYSSEETVAQLSEIQHQGFKGVMTSLNVENPLEIHHDGDLPAKSGLGSSSSFTVGLLNVITVMRGENLSKLELAKAAIHVEHDINKEVGGYQDQIATSYGGLNKIKFLKDGTFEVSPVNISDERKKIFESHILILFTGNQRRASEIEASKLINIREMSKNLPLIQQFVGEGVNLLASETFDAKIFGSLIHDSWKLKRNLSEKVSTKIVDDIYDVARKKGAIGGKLLGAGGGGFMLLFAPPETHPAIKEALSKFIFSNISFENEGSKVIQI